VITVFDHSEKAMMQSYGELIKSVPVLEDLSEQGDIKSLEVLYKNVSVHLATICQILVPYFFSYARDLT
jgi:hypothetical protein